MTQVISVERKRKGKGELLEELFSTCKVILSSKVITRPSVKAGTS